MRKYLLALLLVAPQGAFAGWFAGVELHPANFFILPGGTGLTTKSSFGTGTLFAGISATGMLKIRAFVSKDETGSFQGTGTLFGSTGDFNGKFVTTIFGADLQVSPPTLPLYLRAGFGFASLKSESTFTVSGTPAPDPFASVAGSFSVHGGVGLTFSLALIDIFGGLDAVFVKTKSSSTSATADIPGILFFRPTVGVALSL